MCSSDLADIRFSVVSRQGRPVEMIQNHAAKAALLLLGREPHHPPHFGHTGRTLLRTSPCPVEVIPLPTHPRAAAESITENHDTTRAIGDLVPTNPPA